MFTRLPGLLMRLLGLLDMILLTSLLWLLSFLPAAWLRRFYPRLFWFWCRVFVRALGVDLRLHQKNARPLPDHYLMIANHPSAFEDIGLPALFDVYSLAKQGVAHWWVVGRISRAAGTLFVDREDKASRRRAAEEIAETLQAGRHVALYPEGGCKGRRLQPRFHYGAFDISLRTGVPIVPVFIHYEAQEIFEWGPGQTLVQKIWHFLSSPNRTAHYYVFDAFDPADYADKEQYCDAVYSRYREWQTKYLE